MFAEIRKQMIVDFVNQESNVTLGQLCEKFSVSPATRACWAPRAPAEWW